jgi:general stress protein YciG
MATNQDKDQGKDQGSKQGGKSGSQQSDTSKRGFASMDPEQQREIAAEGGRAAHEKGTAHEFTSEEARRAGSMSHKNDTRSSQSSSSGSASRSGGKAGSEDEDEGRGKGSRGGSSGGSGSKS